MNSHPQNPISRLPKQEALPFEAAQRYEDTVLAWARDQSLPPGIAVTRDCAYGPDPHQRYDVYRSSDAQDAPILIFWHGGGWTNGYKEYVAFMAQAVVGLGMVLVAPDYRLAPAHRLPAAFEDSMAVTGHVIANAAHFGGRSDHIYLAGHSAGAHLAALVALRRDDAIRAGIPPSAIRACLPVSGIMDLHHPEPAAGSLEERVYSMVLRDVADDAVMSPLCWTVGNTIPMVLSYGEFDSARVVDSNRRMAALLARQPGLSQLHEEPGLDHFLTHTCLRESDAAWYSRLADLLKVGRP
ncbi:alpha/beta hydrolase fold domain-containing protein [Hydrogenophaga sp. 2FB]|uniref:alpha/beta hydrolase n=1 Tax=Hydrogenophaga sp. 2FB TaxID=2502187 RepID=UPI0010F8829B|nr:alpha/beta hydrolase fold domain-containing protein [Hydrogenophaga sp. 2FB]